ncbi:MAG: hypothetical protein ACTIDY_09765 [Halomonadaceae bacterium]|uniref:Cyclase dehydrase n=1 Tax=Halomonas colorata TaxID=2742615 RepID=A0ABR9G0B5_9GAMM|nr:hypothetical protein [Halomonas colorata]MBE0464316.1 hypothetical protein [Halomonas colorata]
MHHQYHQSQHMTRSLSTADRVARGLGWLSLGLGLYQLLAPHKLGEQLGLRGHENKVRACGAREMISGIGALTDNPTPAIWSRVGGDTLDLAALTYALQDRHNPKRKNLYLALTAVGIITAVDVYCAQALSKRHAYQAGVTPDYSHRSGFPQGLESARGAARDFKVPNDMQDALPSLPL